MRSRLYDAWEPGQHFAIIAQTGAGKTYAAKRGLLPLWRDVAIFDSSADPSLEDVGRKLSFRRPFPRHHERVGWVRLESGSINPDERERIRKALGRIYKDGRWTVYLDELRLIASFPERYFRLGAEYDRLMLFGRKRGITVISSTQAPRFVPSTFYEQSKWHMIFRLKDARAIKRLGEISGDVDTIEAAVPTLADHEFLLSFPDGSLVRSMVA